MVMSRLIVTNLPKKVSAKKLEEFFASKGCVTDIQLKFTKKGVFRQFAFVGYKTEEDAQAAKGYFDNSYFQTSKIKVDICTNLGDPNKPKAWSKHAKEKEALDTAKVSKNKLKPDNNSEGKDEVNKKLAKTKTGSLETVPKEVCKDPKFIEFLELNKSRTSKPVWCDDTEDFKFMEGSNSSNSDHDEAEDDLKQDKESIEDESKTVKDTKISESKIEEHDDRFTVKVKNLPYCCKKKDLKNFFRPLKPQSIRIPRKTKGFVGFAYVKFKTEKEMNKALNKNKGFLNGHRIGIGKYEKKNVSQAADDDKQQADNTKTDEGELLAESGRIYVRNLYFNVTEEELEKLFSKYGPIAEIHLPIDNYTKKTLGFAFVTYVFAEHAVKAFSELDGTIFQGRLLHLIPAKPKKEIPVDLNNLSYKQKKEMKMKALSGSSHNWNTLFLGINAVADVISEKYNVEKSKLLSSETNESVAVRMALGETQLVVETRNFLLQNGVQLDAFSQPAAERSKTVIIAKNLPAKTPSKEIHDLFSKFGIVSRVILPPFGITALIEFQQATEAKTAFKNLAYSKFHHVPLYLEWAPVNIFKSSEQKNEDMADSIKQEKDNKKKSELSLDKEDLESKEEEEEIAPEPETTLFVKNLNFETTEEKLKKHFKKCGLLHSVSISKKVNVQTGKLLSLGFGFVQFKHRTSAVTALQDLQHSELDGHCLELKFSNRATIPSAETHRKKANITEQKSSKILIRNIPFEVTEKEIKDLFKEFGSLKSVRLPKKPAGQGTHRGFGFVDFHTKNDAKRAFESLCHSTHLLGRRLVLEWANPNSEDVAELRKKTARDFYKGGPKTKVKKTKLMQDVALASAS